MNKSRGPRSAREKTYRVYSTACVHPSDTQLTHNTPQELVEGMQDSLEGIRELSRRADRRIVRVLDDMQGDSDQNDDGINMRGPTKDKPQTTFAPAIPQPRLIELLSGDYEPPGIRALYDTSMPAMSRELVYSRMSYVAQVRDPVSVESNHECD